VKPEPSHGPARHDLVWLSPSWRDSLLTPLQPAAEPILSAWFAAGRPAVACRREPGFPPDAVALGVALPLSRLRARIGFAVARRAVLRAASPLRLAAVVETAPPDWREALAGIDRDAAALGMAVSVYGSLTWQHLTGEPYLDAGSDVDLLLQPRTRTQFEGALDLLRRWDGFGGLRVDGELLIGAGRAVAWREMSRGRDRVLVKTDSSVGLEARSLLLGCLREGLP
jgi:phosphoribosyl-dephospho-CoA transferase